jgi:hypothetical protein
VIEKGHVRVLLEGAEECERRVSWKLNSIQTPSVPIWWILQRNVDKFNFM